MARRNEGFLDLIVILPWWIGVMVAGLVWVVMRHWVPGWLDDSPYTVALGMVSYGFAPYGAGLTLAAAAISGIRSLFVFLLESRDRTLPGPKRLPVAISSRPAVQRSMPRAAAQPLVPIDRSPVTTAARPCPRCGSDLVLRRAARGKNAGSNFWGCSSFPKCRYTEDVA